MRVTRANHGTLDRLFDDFFLPEFSGRTLRNAHSGYRPKVNMSQDDERFTLELLVPGWTKDDFKVELDQDVLTIGAAKPEGENDKSRSFSKREFAVSSFSRGFRLPETANGEQIVASYESGILRIDIPKREEAKPKPAKTIAIG